MKLKLFTALSMVLLFLTATSVKKYHRIQDFQARAYYFSKSKMELGNRGARQSEAQKKQI